MYNFFKLLTLFIFVMYFFVAIVTKFDFQGLILLFLSLSILVLIWFGGWSLYVTYDRINRKITIKGYPHWYVQVGILLLCSYLFLMAVTFLAFYY